MDNNTNSLFEKYAPLMRSENLCSASGLNEALRMAQEGDIETYYAPFDYIERDARLVLVGITPGLTQARNALLEAQRQISRGASLAEAERLAKTAASFSGPMRNNLIRLLDAVGIHQWLGLASTSEVFSPESRLVHYTSVLRYPVFLRGQNYSGNPAPRKSQLLQGQIDQWFAREVDLLGDAIFIPLGSVPQQVMAALVESGRIDASRVMQSLPHPSGANAERIAYFLGTKPEEKCSAKCDTRRLDILKEQALTQVRDLLAQGSARTDLAAITS
ncbi:uracil-DNA glycosylase family protein [Thioalkalivibrio sulfidiphilus]|uniref:Uracil-DNA glycosylase-like domain-containing protein n=1 Tax=Thioalkalivibrio sulfidiphilus (strain HL-EbGR7) TaxID=396588 RepID=B8GSG0_THISH|nr:uracil-DNA glycosylase family protein [Thioalkalivibrio sulfidiphilus]ACL72864.1 conserved hypothetical protein [Thioalkalivibrio sulfidiphilus HL-EbGr7]